MKDYNVKRKYNNNENNTKIYKTYKNLPSTNSYTLKNVDSNFYLSANSYFFKRKYRCKCFVTKNSYFN